MRQGSKTATAASSRSTMAESVASWAGIRPVRLCRKADPVGIRGVSKSRYAAGSRMGVGGGKRRSPVWRLPRHARLRREIRVVGIGGSYAGDNPVLDRAIKFVIPAEDRPKIMTLAALVPGLAGVALFMLPTGPQNSGPIAPEMVLILLGSAFLWALGSIVSQRQSPVHTGNNLGRDAAPLRRGSPPCREFVQGRTCGIFALANIGDLVGWSWLSDVRWIDSRLYSLCLAPRSCASAVGRDLHLRQSDHCRRIGMGAPWRTPDIADVGWLRAGGRFSHRGVAARSRPSGTLMPAARSS